MEKLFKAKKFDDLTARELYEIVRARTEVFLLEQRIICQDLDRVDYDSLHCFIEQGGEVVAYLRAYTEDDGMIHVGRVLTTTHGVGFGRELMELSFSEMRRHFGDAPFTLHAQTQAEGFYAKMGFMTVSDVFMEEGIPHVTMISKQRGK